MHHPGLFWRAAGLALDLLYPPRCVGCGEFGDVLCAGCEACMEPAIGPGRCAHCAAAWDGVDFCPRCFHLDALDRAVAAFEMEGVARKAVHSLKYGFVRDAVPRMAALMEPLRATAPFDVALAVPLHRSRQRSRGFNQAELLLRELGWPRNEGSLRRTRKTATQVGRHARERRANIAGAFEYQGGSLGGKTVALVDDVITTGATANECARVLRDAGASSVIALAFARASYNYGEPEAAIRD